MQPFKNLSNTEVIARVESGLSIDKPDICPETLYQSVLLPCFAVNPCLRPSFNELVKALLPSAYSELIQTLDGSHVQRSEILFSSSSPSNSLIGRKQSLRLNRVDSVKFVGLEHSVDALDATFPFNWYVNDTSSKVPSTVYTFDQISMPIKSHIEATKVSLLAESHGYSNPEPLISLVCDHQPVGGLVEPPTMNGKSGGVVYLHPDDLKVESVTDKICI
jgi:hypothetical protein